MARGAVARRAQARALVREGDMVVVCVLLVVSVAGLVIRNGDGLARCQGIGWSGHALLKASQEHISLQLCTDIRVCHWGFLPY